jgi:hypothetical protein
MEWKPGKESPMRRSWKKDHMLQNYSMEDEKMLYGQ